MKRISSRPVVCALVSVLVTLASAPAPAFAQTLATTRESTLAAASESSSFRLASESDDLATKAVVASATPLASLDWAGLKGRTSTVRIVPFERGVAKGSNLIIIQVEALQAGLIGKRVNGAEITPNLNDLVAQSWYFPNTYSQIARGNTSDVEWVVNTSLYPPINAAATTTWGNKIAPSLPRQLRKIGYKTATLHANAANFWNRRHLYATLGFSRYYDRSFFGTSPFWKWGTSDDVVFTKGLSVLKSYHATGRPFYTQFITMSSHTPFVYPPQQMRPWKATGVYAGTPTGLYLSSESYADAAIGRFIRKLKTAHLWDNSVVVIYGDHFGQRIATTSAERTAQKAFYGRSMRSTDRLRVPLIIHLPRQTEGGRITHTVGQIDILPTIADVLGMSTSGMRLYGRDAFTDSRAVVGMRGVMPNGSFVDDRVIATPGSFAGGTVTTLDSWSARRPTAYERRVRADVLSMMASSLRYTNGLPRRPGVTALASDAIIPNRR